MTMPDTPTARLLDCGLDYEENGQEVHPHPECPIGQAAAPAVQAPAADRDAPTDWIDGHPQLEAIAAAVWEKCARDDEDMPQAVCDDPRNIAVAALAAVLPLLPAPADRAAVLREALPAWEAVYEPGNVSTYLIGYANDQDAATGMAEAWMRSQAEVTGRLEWVDDEPMATDRYDRWFELIECHGGGVDTGAGIVVRRRMADEAQPTEAVPCMRSEPHPAHTHSGLRKGVAVHGRCPGGEPAAGAQP
jgi:hypothetical protein